MRCRREGNRRPCRKRNLKVFKETDEERLEKRKVIKDVLLIKPRKILKESKTRVRTSQEVPGRRVEE